MTAPGAAITVATNIQDTATFARREAAPAPAAATPSRPWTLPRPRPAPAVLPYWAVIV